mgnify:CR=1 FL=1
MDLKTPLRTVLANKPSGVTHQVSPGMTVAAAVEVLNANKVGSVLVMDGQRLVGIFTERDVLRVNGEELGFVLGFGTAVNYLRAYYALDQQGPLPAHTIGVQVHGLVPSGALRRAA